MQLFGDTRELMHYTEFVISQILRIIRYTDFTKYIEKTTYT